MAHLLNINYLEFNLKKKNTLCNADRFFRINSYCNSIDSLLFQQRVINKTHNSLSHIKNLWFCYNAENPFKFQLSAF